MYIFDDFLVEKIFSYQFHKNALICQKFYFKKYIFGLCTIEKISSVHLNKVHFRMD